MSHRIEHLGEGITMMLGDCREIVPNLTGVDAILSDPPYGIAHRRGKSACRGKGVSRGASGIVGDASPFDPAFMLGWPAVLWGADHYAAALPRGRWLLWDKAYGGGSGDFSEFEVAWCSRPGAAKIFRHLWLGVQRGSQVGEARHHPTEKPIALLEWCLGFLPKAQTILDPFMGSGTSGVAAVRAGRSFIGVEIDEAHFHTACRRVADEVKRPRLFADKCASVVQEAMAI